MCIFLVKKEQHTLCRVAGKCQLEKEPLSVNQGFAKVWKAKQGKL